MAFALGGPEVIAIGAVVLLLFGAKKLPELARGIGKASGEFKKAKDEFKHSIETAEEEAVKAEKEEEEKPQN
ncbi:MAG: twin-arginine translocase TatA/TatE family subunit [Verrucomicrobiales bacterium]|nr:twin-arginine translocase TatA/TatE family subunit [Verrucomicrobiales bacterium]